MAFHQVQGRRALLRSATLVAATAPSLAAAPPSKGGGTTRPPVAGAFSPSNYRKPTVGGPMTGVAFAPAVRQPSGANDLVGFNFNAGLRAALPAQQGGFGQVFAPGALLASERVEVERGGATYPAQMVPLATYAAGEPADPAHVGSVKHALVVTAFPALAANATVQAMLRKAASGPGSGNVAIAAGDLSAFSATFVVNSRFARDAASPSATIGASYDVSPGTMLAAGGAETRFSGPLATEIRLIRDIPNTALRVLLDVRKHADGTVRLDYTWACDKALWINGDGTCSWGVTARITQSGTSIYDETWRSGLGQTFRRLIRSAVPASVNALADPPEHNVQPDMPYLAWVGAVPNVDFGIGMSASTIAGWESSTAFMAGSTWRKPNGAGGVRKDLGGTGGRADIGTLPGWHVAYLQSGDDRTRRIVVAQSEAAAAMPINFHDTTQGSQLSPFPRIGYPGFVFNDSQVGGAPANWTMPDYTAGWQTSDTGWAHMPQFYLLAYLLTGDRFHGERMSNLATATIFHINDRGPTDDYLFAAVQPRDRGWSTRSVAQAAAWLPDSNPLRARFRTVLANTFTKLNSLTPAWKAAQGEPWGYVPYSPDVQAYGYLKLWMQDHVHAGVVECVKSNVPGARAFYDWIGHGRTALALQTGIVPVPTGATYEITNMPLTWAGVASGYGLTAWPGGNFVALWKRSLVDRVTLTADPEAAAALANIAAANPPAQYASDTFYRVSEEGWAESRRAMARV